MMTSYASKDAKMACRTALGQVASHALNFVAANSPDGPQKSFLLDAADFVKGLNRIAPPPNFDDQQAPKRLRDAEFDLVAEWCTMYGKEEWSRRPRTFIVLHMIGCREAVEEFVQQGYSDLALPYTASNLPKAVRGDKARRQFLDLQNYVLTPHAQNLEKEGEPHQNVEGSADNYFITRKELGHGSFGQVDHVVGRLSLEHFARKRIPRGKSFKRDQQAIKSFQNELKALKMLSHKHLVKLISSYTDRNWVGLIMKPVAECNFELFLSAEHIDQIDRQTCIRRFFGCLATAMEYLHQHQIRHKDIKPANILVNNRDVLLTDFGTSHNWSDDTRSTSNGTSMGFTMRYCAPEVAVCASRNQSSDVWSLGCVFLEMGTVLNNRKVSEMRNYFVAHGTHAPYVNGNREALTMWLDELHQSSKCDDDMQPLHLTLDMCSEDPDDRPSAELVVSDILDFEGEAPYCGHCCDSENGTLRSTDNELTERGYFLDIKEADDSFESLSIMEPSSDTNSTLVQTGFDKSEELPTSDLPSALAQTAFDKKDGLPTPDLPATLVQIAFDKNNGLPTSDPSSTPAQTTLDKNDEVPTPDLSSTVVQTTFDESDGVPASNPTSTLVPTGSTKNDELPTSDLSSTLAQTTLDKNSGLPTFDLYSTIVPTGSDQNDGLPIPRDIPAGQKQSSVELKSNWKPPTVEDYEGTVTAFYPSTLLDSDSDAEQDGDKNEVGLKASGQGILDNSQFSCEWPGCHDTTNPKLMSTFKIQEELEHHYRSQHLVHEFGRSQILATRESTTRVASLPSPTDAKICLAFVLKNLPPPPATDEGIPVQLRPPADSAQKTSNTTSDQQATSTKASEKPVRRVRFSMLPDSKRPEETIPIREAEDVGSKYSFITPEPLEEPNVPTEGGSKEKNEKSEASTGVKIPKSSMVPSYFLAASNRFTRQEIQTLLPPARLFALVPPPLFVYGSLMFPSILRARAEQFTGAEGIYSQRYQRRLKTEASDWSRIQFSLQRTAEQMTPARLEGYERFKPYGLDNAAISGKVGGSVQGFLLFGLSEEALKCLDHLFSGEHLEELYGDHNFEEGRVRSDFFRRRVNTVISVQGGDIMTVDAVTYVQRIKNNLLDKEWDINKFVRSRTFTKLSGAGQGSFWMEEETRLASSMGMTLVLSGDMLCSAVLRKDKDTLLELLENGYDVNAPCTYHGSTLAAAAYTGQEDFVELLIRQGANVNATGGEYYTPLIAATTQGHDECVRALIKAGADVLAHGGKYISAIYQAVDFGDARLAKILLEKGAWLTKEYRELLDLAAERGNRSITRMIEDYDVRQLYLLEEPPPRRSRISDSRSFERIEEGSQNDSDAESELARRSSKNELDNRRPAPTPLAVVRAVGLQALYLKGQRGKWTGIKGVKVLRAAFDAGVSEKILDTIRPHLSHYQNLVDYLGRALAEYEEEQADQEPNRRALSSGSEGDLPSSSKSQAERRGGPSRTRNDREYSEARSTSRGVRDLSDDSTDDVFCLTCDGRGGRRGTGRNCTNCRGAGTFPTGSGNRLKKCKACNGSGLIFAHRDRCRACNGQPSIDREASILDDPPPPYSSMASSAHSPAISPRRYSDYC